MTTDKSPQRIKQMFNTISGEYDRNNNIISLGFHNLVKRAALKLLKIDKESSVLDLFCGTGDLVNLLLKTNKNLQITGVDFSDKMLEIAKRSYPQVEFIEADCTKLPFKNDSFNYITMSFGLRNVQNREAAIKECFRVLKPSGKVLHLDFGMKNLFSNIFDFITFIGISLFYKNKLPYKYLIDSKTEFPEPQELILEFEKENLKLLKRKDFLFGIISAQVFEK